MKKYYWQAEDEDELQKLVTETLNQMEEQITSRAERNKQYLMLYQAQSSFGGLRPGDSRVLFNSLTEAVRAYGKRVPITLNVVQSCVDTLASRISAQEVHPQFVTDGGMWSEKQKAKDLEKFVEGVFYESNAHREASRACVDALVFGTGFVKVLYEKGKIKLERVFPDEMVIDEQACLTSEPRSMIQIKDVPAEVLIGMFPDKAADIEAAAERDGVMMKSDEETVVTDLVTVRESWHLASSKKAKDGRHSITINGATLFDEKWTEDEFPFVVFRWNRRPIGWYGQGVSEQLESIQLELNKLIQRIQDSMHLLATAKVFIEKGSINKKHWKNTSGDFIEIEPGTGRWPEVHTPSSMSSEVFNHVWTIYQKAYELVGISQLSATSQKPVGVESGVALRTLLDTETQRFAIISKDWEQFFICLAKRIICVAKEHSSGSGGYKARYVGKDWSEVIDFSEVDLDDEQFVMKVYPTNFLPRTPAGRLAYVQELIGTQMIDMKQGLALLDFPDIERYQSLESSNLDAIDMIIEQVIVNGRWIEPPPYLDEELAKARVARAAVRARIDGVPDERIAMLEQWLSELVKPAVPEAPAGIPGIMPPGMPPGMPTMTGPPGPGLPPMPPPEAVEPAVEIPPA